MNRTELLRRLRKETGHIISPDMLRYCLGCGYIDEPPRSSSNRSVYGAKHLRQLVRYVETRRGPLLSGPKNVTGKLGARRSREMVGAK